MLFLPLVFQIEVDVMQNMSILSKICFGINITALRYVFPLLHLMIVIIDDTRKGKRLILNLFLYNEVLKYSFKEFRPFHLHELLREPLRSLPCLPSEVTVFKSDETSNSSLALY